jgi:hypothetical protein
MADGGFYGPPPVEHAPRWRTALTFTLGAAGLIALALYGPPYFDHVVYPAERSEYGTTLAAFSGGAVLASVGARLAWNRPALRPLRGLLVAIALTCALSAVATLGDSQYRDRVVSDYCAYGAASQAQLEECRANVSYDQVRSANTRAASFALDGTDTSCDAGAGPFCQPVATKRDIDNQNQ